MKLPVVSVTLSLNEIPTHLAVAVELGNCKQKCRGCHSPWLSIPLPKSNWMELEGLMAQINKQVKQGADAIVLMGGTYNGIDPDELVQAINILSYYAFGFSRVDASHRVPSRRPSIMVPVYSRVFSIKSW